MEEYQNPSGMTELGSTANNNPNSSNTTEHTSSNNSKPVNPSTNKSKSGEDGKQTQKGKAKEVDYEKGTGEPLLLEELPAKYYFYLHDGKPGDVRLSGNPTQKDLDDNWNPCVYRIEDKMFHPMGKLSNIQANFILNPGLHAPIKPQPVAGKTENKAKGKTTQAKKPAKKNANNAGQNTTGKNKDKVNKVKPDGPKDKKKQNNNTKNTIINNAEKPKDTTPNGSSGLAKPDATQNPNGVTQYTVPYLKFIKTVTKVDVEKSCLLTTPDPKFVDYCSKVVTDFKPNMVSKLKGVAPQICDVLLYLSRNDKARADAKAKATIAQTRFKRKWLHKTVRMLKLATGSTPAAIDQLLEPAPPGGAEPVEDKLELLKQRIEEQKLLNELRELRQPPDPHFPHQAGNYIKYNDSGLKIPVWTKKAQGKCTVYDHINYGFWCRYYDHARWIRAATTWISIIWSLSMLVVDMVTYFSVERHSTASMVTSWVAMGGGLLQLIIGQITSWYVWKTLDEMFSDHMQMQPAAGVTERFADRIGVTVALFAKVSELSAEMDDIQANRSTIKRKAWNWLKQQDVYSTDGTDVNSGLTDAITKSLDTLEDYHPAKQRTWWVRYSNADLKRQQERDNNGGRGYPGRDRN